MNILTKTVKKTEFTREEKQFLWKGEEGIEECDNDTGWATWCLENLSSDFSVKGEKMFTIILGQLNQLVDQIFTYCP